jgi:septum formation protein
MSELVLASSSPRRSDLLRSAKVPFVAVSPPIDEPSPSGPALSPAAVAEALAFFKARSVRDRKREGWVLGADTLVALDGEILGKPASASHAWRMLRALSGSRHAVITGVALLGPDGQRLIRSQTTYVTLREMSDAEVQAYIDSGEWRGKAGAYAIQETADRYVLRVEGSFSNVVGLPMELLAAMLAEARIASHAENPEGEWIGKCPPPDES